MKCYEGSILSVNADNAVFRYLIEDKGRIIYVGNDLPDDYENVEIIKLGNRALIPSFVDSHQHFASFSTFHAGLNVMDAESNDEMLEMIRTFANQTTGKTLICFGASPYSVKEGSLISRENLDTVCPDKEIMVVKYDGHACVVNTKMLKKMDRKVNKLRGYHPDTGEMNQEAFFRFSDYISSSLSLIDLFTNMMDAVDYLAEHGIGMVHTVSGIEY